MPTKSKQPHSNRTLQAEVNRLVEENRAMNDELQMFSFAVALSDVEIPLATAAAYAIRDGYHTEEEAQAIAERIAERLIGHIELMRSAVEVKDKPNMAIVEGASKLILPGQF